MKKKNFWSRRKFFTNIGFGVLGLSFLSNYSVKILTNQNKVLLKERIKINPSAVKRNK